MFLRRFKKSKSLRIVNLLGLSVIFSCLILSYAYIKKELSYDRFHSNADRIVRLSVQTDDEPVDGRVYGMMKNSPVIADVPAIEDAVLMQYVNTGLIEYNGKSEIINDFYIATSNFFKVFDFRLLEGNKNTVIDAPGKVAISKKYARQLFGEESPIGKEIKLSGRRISNISNLSFFINGVFEDFPENSHFHTNLIIHLPDNEQWWTYVYLLLHPGTEMNDLKASVASKMDEQYKDAPQKVSPYIMPLTDIHLHSRVLRELEPNGNINYIYLIAGANLLLLLIVLFNLWLNAGLIFSINRRYYQLLRLNGASSLIVLRDESLLALILASVSMMVGTGLAWLVSPGLQREFLSDGKTLFLLCLSFLFLVVIVSAVPVFSRMSSTLFLSTQTNLRNSGFTLSNVKYMLIGQYGIVMFIIIVSFCITKQIGLIRASQIGGEERTILVLNEQPSVVIERYELLKAELMKHPEIQMVTSAMQLPGSAIRDRIFVWKEGESSENSRAVPLLVVGNDFLPFFNIQPIAGGVFQPNKHSFKEEQQLMDRFFAEKEYANASEEYVLNQKAIQQLGFGSPEEAIGKRLYFSQGSIDYINNGTIVGVTENFNYTTTYEVSIPQILLQRALYQSCFMVYLSPEKTEQAVQTFNRVWNEINPEYQAQYTFLHEVYNSVYHNELNAEQLVRVFSLLCLIIATLGLIIIMAFVVKRKTKEIGIRKVNGATTSDIIRMLNGRFVMWIAIAFLLAVPGAYVVMVQWLKSFAYKTSLDWWIFLLAGFSVLLLSVAAISWQSWRAATIDPVKTLKSE